MSTAGSKLGVMLKWEDLVMVDTLQGRSFLGAILSQCVPHAGVQSLCFHSNAHFRNLILSHGLVSLLQITLLTPKSAGNGQHFGR